MDTLEPPPTPRLSFQFCRKLQSTVFVHELLPLPQNLAPAQQHAEPLPSVVQVPLLQLVVVPLTPRYRKNPAAVVF